MALIGKIRQRTGLLLGFIGIALIIFLVQAALNDGASLGGSNKPVGKINGKKIPAQNYLEKFDAYSQKVQALNPDFQMNEEGKQNLSNEVWNEFIIDGLLGKTFKALGLTVTDNEISDAFTGKHIHPLILNYFGRYFVNPQTGQFDKIQFGQMIKNMDQDPSGNLRKTIAAIESIVEQERIKEKYIALISKSYYTPTFIAEESINNNKTVVSDIVYLPSASVPDSDVKVSDEEIKAFLKKYPSRFLKGSGRILDIVTFNLSPSESDMMALNQQLNSLVEEFKTTTEDSLFIERNALRGFDKTYYGVAELRSKPNAAEIVDAAPGTFIGPYREGINLITTKVLDKKMIADSVSASHILLKLTSQAEVPAAEKLADSIIIFAKSGVPFEQLVLKYSTDDQTKMQGGSLGTFPKGVMPKPINDEVFYEMNTGDYEKVFTQSGLHIIKKTGQSSLKPAVKIADIYVEINPSKETVADINNKANDFFQRSQTAASFDKNSTSLPVLKDVFYSPDQINIQGVGANKELQQWVFNAKEPGVVNLFDLEDKFAVIKIKSFVDGNEPDFETSKNEVKAIITAEKKAEIQKKKLEAAAKSGQTLEQIALATGGQYKAGSPLQLSANYIDGVGFEPKLLGTAFGLKEGQQSKAVAGTGGAFIVKVVSIMPNPVSSDIEASKKQINSFMTRRYTFESILKELKKSVKIEDQRYLY